MADPVSKALNIVRRLSPSGFFSRAAEEAANIPQAKGTGEQMRKMLLDRKGVKKEELKWTGFDDWVKGKKSVTRDEVVDFLRRNEVQVGEAQPGGKIDVGAPERTIGGSYNVPTSAGQHRLIPFLDETDEYGEAIERYSVKAPDGSFVGHDFDSVDEALAFIRNNPSAQPKFEEYTIPGGENYRELLLTRPSAQRRDYAFEWFDPASQRGSGQTFADEASARAAAPEGAIVSRREIAETNPDYRSSHWDDPNVLAHMRMSDRVDPEGRRVLHLEELQSDWAQEGRKRGFDTPEMRAKLKTELPEGYTVRLEDFQRTGQPERYGVFDPTGVQVATGYGRENAINSALNSLNDAIRGTSASPVPSAPFVESTPGWTNLALRRAMIEAARGNFDAIAWTPGAEQAKRYDLSKQIDDIRYAPSADGKSVSIEAYRGGDNVINRPNIPMNELPNFVGKEVAERIAKGVGETDPNSGYRVLSGLDLQVGGEGMKGYYDKILPTQISKVLKDIGETPQFGTISLPVERQSSKQFIPSGPDLQNAPQSYELPSLAITPAMREKINQGLPLFTMLPAAVGLGTIASQVVEGQNPAEEPQGFAGGGKIVQKALKAVADLFETPEMAKWRGKSVIPSARVEDRYFTGTSKDKDFPQFNVGRHGVWLTKDPAEASRYALENDSMGYRMGPGWSYERTNTASRVIPVFARAENPYTGPMPDFVKAENYKRAQSDWFDQLRSQGHDAWLPESSPDLAVILRDPEQIKSAISNTGDFSGPRIDREDGGRTVDDALRLIQDKYPTHYLPNVGRQVMADGGSPVFPVTEGDANAQLNDAVSYANALDRAARVDELKQSLSETWPAQLAKSIVSGVTLPRDVYEGRVDPASEEGIRRALDLSGAVMGGGLATGSAPRGSIGMFLGPSAKTADLAALETAREMAKKGATRDEIYDATKWFQGADKQWRFEIPDTAASMRPGYIERSTVGEAIEHPELFKAYPQLADVEFYASPLKRTNIQGGWSGNPNVKDTFPTLQVGQYAKDPRSTALHELQHAVQAMENFAPGGNTFALKPGTPAWGIYQERLAAMKNPLPLETYAALAGFGDDVQAAAKSYPSYLKAIKNPSEVVKREAQKYAVESAYKRAAGEVEARNVQARDKSGYDKKPWETQDVSDEMQIVRERLKEKDGGAIEGALHVVRGMYADGGEPTAQGRRRAALEELGAFEDRPVMDPATMGENWAAAVERFRRTPLREGETVARPLELGGRDVVGGMIAGDGGTVRGRLADVFVGSRGTPGSGTLNMGVADFTPLGVPLAISDMSDALRNQDYLSAGLSALGPAAYFARRPLGQAARWTYENAIRPTYDAGRRAVDVAGDVLGRVPAPVAAGAAGAAVMAPEDAEASKSKMARQVMGIVRSITPPPSNKDPRFWHNISSTKLSRPIDEMRAGYAQIDPKFNVPVRPPSDYEGKALITTFGDPSIGGVKLLSVNEKNLVNPTLMQAGPAFVHGAAARGPDRSIWASDLNMVSALANRAAAAQKAGYEPFLNYVKMGGESPDYSHHITDPLLDLFRQSKVNKDVVAKFDEKMRTGFNKDFPPYPDWPGLRSKKLDNYLFETGPGKARTAMAKLMATGDFQKLGMPDVGAVRFAATAPDLLNVPNYSSGRMIARMDPTATAIRNPAVPHKTYRAQLSAHPEGADPARFSGDIPLEISHYDWVKNKLQEKPNMNPSQLQYTYTRSSPTLYMTPETVDRISTFLDLKARGLIP